MAIYIVYIYPKIENMLCTFIKISIGISKITVFKLWTTKLFVLNKINFWMYFLESAGQVRAGLRASLWNSARDPHVARNILARPSPPRSDSSPHPPRTRTYCCGPARGARGLRGPRVGAGWPAPRRALVCMTYKTPQFYLSWVWWHKKSFGLESGTVQKIQKPGPGLNPKHWWDRMG